SQHFNQNQSCDEYYDSLSYPFQEERYGQDEEDRQWDSGGYPQVPPPKTNSKKLPSIPVVQNYMNKRRSSNALDEGYSCYDEPYRSTPTTRRKMPQIPSKRSTSRQSSLNDGFRTPENTSHRGASLPPTPTKTPKMPPRVAAQAKPFNSLPPTPGRQLPKPNLNHRSAKTRRNNLMKSSSSAEYNENAMDYDSYYIRPGAMSAKEMYNEDYNYAYQSIDNLPAQPEELEVNRVEGFSDSRTSEVINTLNVKNGTLQYQSQSIDDYYYSAQEDRDYQDCYNDVRKKKLLGKRTNSPLQQNTDSLESRDDDLKDSFETAGFLEPQESVESYVEDELESGPEFNSKAISHDSPSSVIHVESYGDDQSLRRGSSQITVVDPYHPYASAASRRPSAADPRRASDGFQNCAQDDPYLPRKTSLRVSPTPPERQEIPEEAHDEDELPEKKSVSFEEEEEAKPRPQVTAQQRWLWAYNKIIMQLNKLNLIDAVLEAHRCSSEHLLLDS
ncbi:Spc7 N domain containing protein, partial [Asbolus verrucosus]